MTEFSASVGFVFGFFCKRFGSFLGKESLTEKAMRVRPERITRAVFHDEGSPKNGTRKIKMPRKNVLFFCIIKVVYQKIILISK